MAVTGMANPEAEGSADRAAASSGAAPLRVGVIGIGKIGTLRSQYVQQHVGLQLTAVCDINPSQATAAPGVRFYRDYRQLLDDDLDAVFVCVHNNVAPDVVIEAINRGLHVFCEKPPGQSATDVERIIAAEQASPHLKLQFGFNHRCHYAVREAKAMIDSGRFGEILWMRGVYGKAGGLGFEQSWRNDRAISGGGILLDQGIHMLDLFRYFGGEFPKVKSVVTTAFWDIPVEDNAFAILQGEGGQVAMIHSSATQWKHRFSLEICLREGYININGILSSTRSYGEESLTFARRQFEDQTFAFGKPREETIYFDRDDSWQIEIAEFVNAIRNNQPIRSGNSHDALKVMQLLERIYEQGAQ